MHVAHNWTRKLQVFGRLFQSQDDTETFMEKDYIRQLWLYGRVSDLQSGGSLSLSVLTAIFQVNLG